jgi:hypothetical protein
MVYAAVNAGPFHSGPFTLDLGCRTASSRRDITAWSTAAQSS